MSKERDLYLAELLEREVITQFEFRDLVFKPEINAFDSNYLSSWFIDKINFGWSAWQAAKAQAVPEVLKKFCNEHKDPAWRGRLTEYDKGYSDCCIAVLEMIEAQEPSSTSDCPDEP